jgi:hypothetical protein
MREITTQEREQKQREWRKKVIDEKARRVISGWPLICSSCQKTLFCVSCPNKLCGQIVDLDPILRRIIEILREENRSSSSGSTSSSRKGKKEKEKEKENDK